MERDGRMAQLHPPLDLLTGRSFPELAAAIRARAAVALSTWEKAVRQALPSADELTFGQLRDNLSGTLETMADAVAAAQRGPTEALMTSSGEHGTTRFHQNYRMNELLIEYHLLRRVVFDEVSQHLGRPLSGDEVAVLNTVFDAALRQSVVAFCDHQAGQLRAATERHSKYLSFLSHDLRGGLNGIFLMTDVIRRALGGRPEFAELTADLEMLRGSIRNTVATMDRFLDAERFRKGKVKANPAPVNLKLLLRELVSQFTYQAREKGIELKVEWPQAPQPEAARATPPTLVCDRELLSMVLQNLVSNAVKYTRHGSVRVMVTPPARAGEAWRLCVADEGPGIAPDKLGELFTAFSRGETHGQRGVGLGLSIVHQAAQLMGAKVWAESELGRGSRFYVELPDVDAPSGVARLD
jgi:signal transduction histidine kinase